MTHSKMASSALTPTVSASDHVQGDQNAPVVLVEYGDYECPYCGQAASLVKAAQAQMGDKLCFVFRNFPLAEMHPHAAHAAQAAEAADAQGQFWPMHDLLYENQDNLEDADLAGYAAKLGLDKTRFAADLSGGQSDAKVQADFESGAESGVNGTPSFFINGVRFDGDWQGDGLLQALQSV